MFTYNEVKDILIKRYNKPYNQWSEREKAILTDAAFDCSIGRYSKFLLWSYKKVERFFEYCSENDVDYFDCTDPVRWALEDSFCM